MKQYFAYGAFTVCLVNAIVRPDFFSVILVGVACVLVIVSMFMADEIVTKNLWQAMANVENRCDEKFTVFDKELRREKQLSDVLCNRLEALEKQNSEMGKELADAKRTVTTLNLQNTFVPRAKRNAGVEL